jgi:sporulation protein YlmC with PRC-barrel domain
MHRSLLSMKDLPLMTAAGVRIGEIADAYFDPFEQRILAFRVEWEDTVVLGPDDLLPITQLLELNADIGTVADEIGVTAGLEPDLSDGTADGLQLAFVELIDHVVVDAAGARIGRLADLQFDPQDGSVEFYEIVSDHDDEALMLPPDKGIEMRDSQLIVPPGAMASLRRAKRSPELAIAFLEAEGFEDLVGEDDLEVSRASGTEGG